MSEKIPMTERRMLRTRDLPCSLTFRPCDDDAVSVVERRQGEGHSLNQEINQQDRNEHDDGLEVGEEQS